MCAMTGTFFCLFLFLFFFWIVDWVCIGSGVICQRGGFQDPPAARVIIKCSRGSLTFAWCPNNPKCHWCVYMNPPEICGIEAPCDGISRLYNNFPLWHILIWGERFGTKWDWFKSALNNFSEWTAQGYRTIVSTPFKDHIICRSLHDDNWPQPISIVQVSIKFSSIGVGYGKN